MKEGYFEYLTRVISEIRDGEVEFDPVILHVPKIFKLLCDLLDRDEVDRNSRLLINSSLAYFVSPSDVLPEEVYGPYGYIDDLYLGCAVLKQLDSKYHNIILGLWNDEDYDSILDSCFTKGELFLEEKGLKDKLLRYAGLED